jgi:hypothetical protein
MSLNPITALTGQFEKLITEHGSAAIQEKHIAFFRDQLTLFEKKSTLLESENTVLKTENDKLKSELEESKKENEILREKIQEYEQPLHGNLLEEVKGRILYWLSKNSMSADQVANTLQIGLEVAKFHLQELKEKKMVKDGFSRAKLNQIIQVWSVDQEGRRYLVENKIIA